MLVHYLLANTADLPPISAPLYEYIFAGNGVFKRAVRNEMSATIPVSECVIRGLALIKPELSMQFNRIPELIVQQILDASCEAASRDLEILFHLSLVGEEWRLDIPPQIQCFDSVEPIEKGAGSSYEKAIIEIHSHHRMPAKFSPDDDSDETGFRIYGVIGSINRRLAHRPKINFRIGVYGDWWPLPADRIIEMPPRLIDCNATDEQQDATA
jgi:PRTRC genetic system protein A